MSSFAINGRLIVDPDNGPTASAHAVPSCSGDGAFERRRSAVQADTDPRLYVLELVAALAAELHRRGDHITQLDVE